MKKLAKNKKLKSLGTFLKSLRTKKKLKQMELAAHLGLDSRSYISEIESGKKIPTIEFLAKYADFFEIKISKIFIKSGL